LWFFLRAQITFLDAARLDEALGAEDERERLRSAARKIRARRGFENIPIVLIVENAPGQAGAYLDDHMRNEPGPCITMRECARAGSSVKRRGVPKTETTTVEMRMVFRKLLAEGRVRIDANLVSLTRETSLGNDSDGVAEALAKLQNQMTTYNPYEKKRYGEQFNDDLLIALMMIPYWRAVFWNTQDTEYIKFRSSHLTTHVRH
jgi:hypothetical protein